MFIELASTKASEMSSYAILVALFLNFRAVPDGSSSWLITPDLPNSVRRIAISDAVINLFTSPPNKSRIFTST